MTLSLGQKRSSGIGLDNGKVSTTHGQSVWVVTAGGNFIVLVSVNSAAHLESFSNVTRRLPERIKQFI